MPASAAKNILRRKQHRVSWFLERAASFFTDNFPQPWVIITSGPLGFVWALSCLSFAAYLKKWRRWRTGYTRKVFHFLIFFSVALIQWLWGTPAVCLFGGMTTCVVFLAVMLGAGHPLYEAMARAKDAPHRTHFIVVPYLATLLGGLLGNIVFGPVAIMGYLATGLGDAVGEPVGTRFGRHQYKVPSIASVKAVRSWEGSLAVLVMCVAAITLGIAIAPDLSLSHHTLLLIPVLALACAGVEAVSPHGWDNLTMQVVPTMLAFWLLV